MITLSTFYTKKIRFCNQAEKLILLLTFIIVNEKVVRLLSAQNNKVLLSGYSTKRVFFVHTEYQIVPL